jgi:hypothetical protein
VFNYSTLKTNSMKNEMIKDKNGWFSFCGRFMSLYLMEYLVSANWRIWFMYVTFPCKHDTHFDFAPMCRVSCFINVICSYLHIPVSNTISMSYDIRVNQQQHDVHHRCLLRFMLLKLYFSVYYCVNHCLSFFCFGDYVVHFWLPMCIFKLFFIDNI